MKSDVFGLNPKRRRGVLLIENARPVAGAPGSDAPPTPWQPIRKGMEPASRETDEIPREFVDRLRGLDPRALDELVDAYAGRLHGFFRRMIPAGDDAEDLVQEVFLRVVRVMDDYREQGRFEAWLFRIAGNLARDHLRRRAAGSRFEPSGAEDNPLDGLADRRNASPQQIVELAIGHGERVDRLQVCLERLSAEERAVVLMRHYGELSFQEIAEFVGAPLGTVLARAHRGLDKLRRWMESES